MTRRSRTYVAIPPGATIKEQLEIRGMSQKEFAARMGLSEKHTSQLIHGDVQLTPETAVKLEMVLGVPAQFWLNLEAIYREKIIKVEAENDMDEDKVIARKFPYNEMVQYGWIEPARTTKEKVVHLRKYFGVVKLSLLGNEQITKIACRRLKTTEKSDLALMAWSQEAKKMACDLQVPSFAEKKVTAVLPQIRKMTTQKPEEFMPQLKEFLLECGAALVFLPHLQGSFLQGASFMDGNKAIVGLTTREYDVDQFWFSLFHELAHIILGHLHQPEGTSESDERKADQWAENALISEVDFEKFLDREDYSQKSILNFAHQLDIAPGIVVGRLQREGLLKDYQLNTLKEKYELLEFSGV